jgi:hypothetical protein
LHVHHHEAVRRRLRRAAIFLLVSNLLFGLVPSALAAPGIWASTVAGDAPTAPRTGLVDAFGALAGPAQPGETGQTQALPSFAPVPLSLSNNTAQNFTPYAPSAFTYGGIGLTTNADGVNIAALPNITVNQTGNLTVGFNGTWNPAPASQADRDWVMAFAVRNGAVEVLTVEANTSFRANLTAGQLPFALYFGLPTHVAGLGATSTARVAALLPSGNVTVLNLTAANAGISLLSAKAVSAAPTDSVWFNASGSYPSGGVLSGSQIISVLVPNDGSLPFAVHAGRVSQWEEPFHFPGARVFLLRGGTGLILPGSYRLTGWTRGSPESSMWLNATVTTSSALRNDSLNISGEVATRTLTATTTWTVNQTSALPPSTHSSSNCNTVVRLVNGTYRMFCNFVDNSGGGTDGVESAFSRDGVKWAWEGGIRFQLCGGKHPISQLTFVRQLDGGLRMYFGGSETAVSCTLFGSGTHISSATSGDEGVTWTSEFETLSNFSVSAPDARAVVPTAEGHLRMYYDSASGLSTALSDDGITWAFEATIGGSAPRAMYLLTDGSYKMYFGTTSISSRTSFDGLAWSGTLVEVTSWGIGSIEAGPILDRGDGNPLMMIYSQSDGLFFAAGGGLVVSLSMVNVVGRVSDGQVFGSASAFSGARGAFFTNLTIPPPAPLGRYFVSASAGFGENRFRGVVLNRMPVWSGPAQVAATEDVPLALDLRAWASDGDTADVLQFFVNSPYATINGSVVTLLYPNGVLSDSVLGIVNDGHDNLPFNFLVNVTPVNDAPTINLAANYTVMEDQLTFVDFTGAVADPEFDPLNLSTNVSGAIVLGLLIGFNFTNPGTYPITVSVTDGTSTVNGTTMIIVLPRNDPPVVSLQSTYNGLEDTMITLNFSADISDVDTPRGSLVVSTDLPNATVNGFVVSLTVSDPGPVPFNITVSDGFSAVQASSVLIVAPRNDPPVWVGAPDVSGVVEGEVKRVDLRPLVHDDDNTFNQLTFGVDSPYARISGGNLELQYPDGVLADSFNLSVSDGEYTRIIVVNVSITPVNTPPVLTNAPPTNYTGSGPLQFQLTVFDPDSSVPFSFALTTAASWITLSAGGRLTFDPQAVRHGRFEYSVVVTDPGGASSPRYFFNISLPDNNLPSMSPSLPAHAVIGTPYSAQFNVTDPDVGDTVTVTATGDDPNQTITLTNLGSGHWRFAWTPTYSGFTPPFVAWFNGTLVLNDTIGQVLVAFAIRATDPTNRPPSIPSQIPAIQGVVNQTTRIDLTNYTRDPDSFDTIDQLQWTFEGDISAIADFSYDNATHILSIHFTHAGPGALTFRLTDPSGLSASQAVAITGVSDTGAPPGDPTNTPFPWWLILILIGGGIAGVVAWRRFRAPGVGEAPLAETPLPGGSAASAPLEAVPAQRPIIVPAAANKRTFLVEDLFLLYRDGRTVFTRAGLAADAVEDPESVGAMLVAVQDFVKDSFRKNSPVDRMGYGDNVILLEQGGHCMLAVTVFGEPDREFRELLTETIRNVEATYAGVVENWSGNRADFVGVDQVLAPIWRLTADLTRGDVLLATTAREVQMLSGVEFFQGYVRIKVGVVNNTATVITNVTVDLDFNADVLRLAKIEPATYKMAGTKVNLGVLHTGEKATLAYYFDPQICTMSMIDGTCRYKDAEGAQHIVQMKSRKAEVVCPLFFTKEQANTAMLRRLVETELKEFDVRAYSFKASASAGELGAIFEALKGAVLAHEVLTVRAYERHNPYTGEAWFYGKTQVKGYQMVIRAVVDEEKGRAEFFVASSVMRTITGLLAEMHHTFMAAARERLGDMQVVPLFEEGLRSEYANVHAVSKMIEGEAAAGESEAPSR